MDHRTTEPASAPIGQDALRGYSYGFRPYAREWVVIDDQTGLVVSTHPSKSKAWIETIRLRGLT